MPNALRLEDAYALRDEGRYSESRDAFREIEERTDNVLLKANARLGSSMAAVGLADNDLARKHLAWIKEFLTHYEANSNADDDFEVRRLKILVAVQEAIIEAAEGKPETALGTYDSLIDSCKADLLKQEFSDIRDTLYGEKAFLLADLMSFEQALPILEKLEASQSRNSSVLFYLGYCYMEMKMFTAARDRLEKATALGLTGNFRFRARWALGITLCGLGDYENAKVEFERSRKTASEFDVVEGKLFQWLKYCCQQLGLEQEAAEYARLAEGSGPVS